ncbi:MAG: hypothetical protein ACFFCW_29125 [Candidatus Hodarchaeota archaeon]
MDNWSSNKKRLKMHFPKVNLNKKGTLVLLWLVLSNLLLFFGGTLNPLTAGEQFLRRTQLTSLLDTKNPDIRALNADFEQFLQDSEQIVKTRDQFSSLEVFEVNMVEIFTYLRVKHKSDTMQYLTIDHLPTISEVMQTGVDDCDGRAILAATLLISRGYDAWVLANPWHYWVEVFLENDAHLNILKKKRMNFWHMRFNDQKVVFNYILTVGYIFYQWFLVTLILTFLFFSHKYLQMPFIRSGAKILLFVVIVTQIIYFGALGIVLLLYRII